MQFVKVGEESFYTPEKVFGFELVQATALPGAFELCGGDEAELAPSTHLKFLSDVVVEVGDVEERIADFGRRDDVFSTEFLKRVYVSGMEAGSEPPRLGEGVEEVMTAWGTEVVCRVSFVEDVPEGPYFSTKNGLRQAWRLYEDGYGAFVTGVVPGQSHNKYEALPSTQIAVPSRLYSPPPTPAKPFSGLRFTIKDIFDLSGVRTSNSSRAFHKLYAPRKSTAPVIQSLLDLGGIIIGKTKTAQFAAAEHPIDWFDAQCSFSPRGDGYQAPSGSSTGAAVAEAAYAWVDLSVGSDTFGSIVHPAYVNGLFGIRPTWGIQDLGGALKLSERFDTCGFFVRDVELLEKVTKAWILNTQPAIAPDIPASRKIYYFSDLAEQAHLNSASQKAIAHFLSSAERILNAEIFRTSLSSLWQNSPLTPKESLETHLSTSLAHLQLYEGYHNNLAFRAAYRDKFGEEAFVDPLVQHKWDLGEKLTAEEHALALEQRETFRAWLRQEIIPPGSETLLVLPVGSGNPVYRTKSAAESSDMTIGFGFSAYMIPALASLPAVAVPIGESKYLSKVSGREEYHPLGVTLVGAGGTDHKLVEVVRKLTEESPGLLTHVTTGKRCWQQTGGI